MCLTKTAGALATAGMLLFGVSTPLAGQWRSEPVVRTAAIAPLAVDPLALRLPDSRPSAPPDDYTLVMAGIVGAAVGTLGGAYLGYQADYNYFNWGCQHGCEDPGILGAVGGWFIGPALTTPISVHLAHGRRGSLSPAYLSSALIASAGFAGLMLVGSPNGAFFLWGAPAAQVISAVLIERRGSR